MCALLRRSLSLSLSLTHYYRVQTGAQCGAVTSRTLRFYLLDSSIELPLRRMRADGTRSARVARFSQQNPPNCYLKIAQRTLVHKTPGHQQRKSSNVLYIYIYIFLNTCITQYFVLYHLCIRGVPPVKTRSEGYKIHVFGEVNLVKFALHGLNIMLLGSLQPAATVLKFPNSAGKQRTWQHSSRHPPPVFFSFI